MTHFVRLSNKKTLEKNYYRKSLGFKEKYYEIVYFLQDSNFNIFPFKISLEARSGG